MIRKIKKMIYSLYLTIKYSAYSLLSKKTISCDEDLFTISLTSYGYRINFVFLTIESLIQQETMPSKIVLWLYKKDKPSGFFSFFLNRQIKRGLQVEYLVDDMRSYKKLSYMTRGEYSSSYYVTADDDVFYPSWWLTGFKKSIEQKPYAVYCYRGRIIEFCDDEMIVPYNNWKLADKYNKGNMLLPTGVSGICYPVKALDERIRDFSSIKALCPYADDIWYKMITTANKAESLLVLEESIHFTPIITGFFKGLEKFNVYEDKNTTQFMKALKYFKLNAQSFR